MIPKAAHHDKTGEYPQEIFQKGEFQNPSRRPHLLASAPRRGPPTSLPAYLFPGLLTGCCSVGAGHREHAHPLRVRRRGPARPRRRHHQRGARVRVSAQGWGGWGGSCPLRGEGIAQRASGCTIRCITPRCCFCLFVGGGRAGARACPPPSRPTGSPPPPSSWRARTSRRRSTSVSGGQCQHHHDDTIVRSRHRYSHCAAAAGAGALQAA